MSADPSSDVVPAGPAPSQIPDIIKIGSVPSDTSIDVETSILEPVSFSQSQCHFVLENKGILHSNSRITFALDNASMGDLNALDHCFFPPGVGVHSLLQRVRLAVGGKTISEIEDFNEFMAYESIFIAPETAKEREQVFSGRVANSVRPCLNERVDAQGKYQNASNSASNTESVFEARSQTIDNGIDLDYDADARRVGGIAKGVDPQPSKCIYGWQNQNNDNHPVFSVLLADLFPFLKMNQLPLYMIDEQVTVTLTFEPKAWEGYKLVAPIPASHRITKTSLTPTPKRDANIDRNQVKLIADYIYYPQEMMMAYQAANQDMSFTYVDYQFVKRTVAPAEMSSAGGLIQNLGGAGRIVNKVIVGCMDPDNDDGFLLNKYHAKNPDITATTAGQVTTNLRYNDLFLFPIDVSNYSRHFHNVFSAEGRMPHLPRGWYSGEGAEITGSRNDNDPRAFCQFEEYGDLDSLDGFFFWTAYRLNRNERVNSRGIELYDRRVTNDDTFLLHAYLQVVRMASLRQGVMTVTYA